MSKSVRSKTKAQMKWLLAEHKRKQLDPCSRSRHEAHARQRAAMRAVRLIDPKCPVTEAWRRARPAKRWREVNPFGA